MSTLPPFELCLGVQEMCLGGKKGSDHVNSFSLYNTNKERRRENETEYVFSSKGRHVQPMLTSVFTLPMKTWLGYYVHCVLQLCLPPSLPHCTHLQHSGIYHIVLHYNGSTMHNFTEKRKLGGRQAQLAIEGHENTKLPAPCN